MPELPEVETVRRGLERLVAGRRLQGLDVIEAKCFIAATGASPELHLIGATVTAARRRGKVLILDLDSDYCLVVHLKMTGQMIVRGPENWAAGHPNDSFIGELPDRSTRLVFDFEDETRLFFNDQRKFGWAQLMQSTAVSQLPLLAKMGPEPLTGDPWPEFRQRIGRHRTISIKAALLNQEVIAGIGNIYADEALWAARVHPATPVNALTDRRLKSILSRAIEVMELSISLGGSTDRNYLDAQGRRGAYLDFAKVFRRQGLPCPRCGRPIAKTRVAGRGTHTCPRCQRLSR